MAEPLTGQLGAGRRFLNLLSAEQTDVESFAVLEPAADGFRNYLRAGETLSPETLVLDRAFMLTLTAPQITVLIGGMRALNANVGQSPFGASRTGRGR